MQAHKRNHDGGGGGGGPGRRRCCLARCGLSREGANLLHRCCCRACLESSTAAPGGSPCRRPPPDPCVPQVYPIGSQLVHVPVAPTLHPLSAATVPPFPPLGAHRPTAPAHSNPAVDTPEQQIGPGTNAKRDTETAGCLSHLASREESGERHLTALPSLQTLGVQACSPHASLQLCTLPQPVAQPHPSWQRKPKHHDAGAEPAARPSCLPGHIRSADSALRRESRPAVEARTHRTLSASFRRPWLCRRPPTTPVSL